MASIHYRIGFWCGGISKCAVSAPAFRLPRDRIRRPNQNKDSMVCCSSSFEGSEEDASQEIGDQEKRSLWCTLKDWYQAQQQKSKKLRDTLLGYGPAAVLAYGLFDGLSYSIAFAIAFLGYEARTGLNPTSNVGDIVKICILMWAGNNVTRPFRLAGAAALAPPVDILLIKVQKKLKLPRKIYAFFILTAIVAGICLSGVGALIFSRWIQDI
jgi:hypothetical protein